MATPTETSAPKTREEMEALRVSDYPAYLKELEKRKEKEDETKPIAETLRDNEQAGLVTPDAYNQRKRNEDYAKKREGYVYSKGVWRKTEHMSPEDKAAHEAGMDPVEYRRKQFEEAQEADKGRFALREQGRREQQDAKHRDAIEERLKEGSPWRASVDAANAKTAEEQRPKSAEERAVILANETGAPVTIQDGAKSTPGDYDPSSKMVDRASAVPESSDTYGGPKVTVEQVEGNPNNAGYVKPLAGQVSTDGGETYSSIAGELAKGDKASGYRSVEDTLKDGKQMPQNNLVQLFPKDHPPRDIQRDQRMHTGVDRGASGVPTTNVFTGERFKSQDELDKYFATNRGRMYDDTPDGDTGRSKGTNFRLDISNAIDNQNTASQGQAHVKSEQALNSMSEEAYQRLRKGVQHFGNYSNRSSR